MLRFAIVLLLLVASRAHAEDAYRTAIDTALLEYELGNFAEARAQFLRAHELLPTARSLRGLGMAEFELRNYGVAIEHLEAALVSEEKPLDQPLREQTEALIARARAYVANVSLKVLPENASLTVDGVIEPARTLTLEVGDHALEFRAPGHRGEKHVVKVTGGEQLALNVTLDDERVAGKRWYRNPWLWSATALVIGGVTAGVLMTRDPGTRSVPPEGGTSAVSLMGPARMGLVRP